MTDNKWIKWNGGERPVHQDVGVQYKMRDFPDTYADYAGALMWDWKDQSTDIISYRIIEPSESLSESPDTKPQDNTENVSQSLTDAFKAIQELCIEKGIGFGVDSLGNVEIHTNFGSYVLDITREDLEDVITKMADVNKIIKGEG